MPERENTIGYPILVLNQRFLSRLVIAGLCLIYLAVYFIHAAGLNSGFQTFLIPSVYAAVFIFIMYSATWIANPNNNSIHHITLIAIGFVSLHLTGSLLINNCRVEIALSLFAFIILVNAYFSKLKEAFIFNTLLIALLGFSTLLSLIFIQASDTSSADYHTIPLLELWLSSVLIAAVLLLIKVYYQRSKVDLPEQSEEEKLKSTDIENNPAATILIDSSTGLIIDCNMMAIRILDGYEKSELIGKDLNLFQKQNWTSEQKQHIQRTLGRKGKVAVNTTLLTLKDRELKSTLSINLVFSKNVKRYYVTISEYIDIELKEEKTSILNTSAQSSSFAEQVSAVLESSDYAIVAVNRQHIVQVINSKLADELFGLTGIRVTAGFNLKELIPAQFSTRYMALFEKGLQGESSIIEEEIELAKEKRQTIEVHINPLITTEGQITGVSFFGRNISDQKKSENDLVKTREQALAEVRAKSDFLATMSHEIRTPLNGVIGMSHLLEKTVLSPKQKDFVNSLLLSGEALLSVINDILDYSKIESAKMQLEIKPFALRRCIEETFDLLAAKAAEKGLLLRYSMHRSVPTFILGDITRLRQVLLNLVSNAIKFTEKGKIEIHVSVDKKEANNQYQLFFEVRDTGIGISADKIERLFKVYSQASEGTAKKYGGTGLGLAISKNLVELMGGKIWVRSNEGSGSSFFFTIAAGQANSTELINQSSKAAKQLVNSQALIISDEKNTALLFADYFSRWGMKTLATDDAEELIELVKGNEIYQVIAIDAKMLSARPQLLAKKIRESREKEELSIVLFNADDREHLTFDHHDEVISAVLPAEMDRSKILNILLGIISEDVLQSKHASELVGYDKSFATRLPLNVLVAEDNKINQKLAHAIFESLGYTIDLADDGRQAITKLKNKRYDIVFMDVQMPEMDGFEATQWILNEFDKENRPAIIAMTAFALEGDKEKCLNAGMNDYISKPIMVEEITDKLKKWGGERDFRQPVISKVDEKSPSLLDTHVINRLLELNEKFEKGFFQEVLDMFFKQAPVIINEMIQYCQEQRFDKMSESAHKLKGSALNVGAKAMADVCREIEVKGKNNQVGNCNQILDRLTSVYAASQKELNKIVSSK